MPCVSGYFFFCVKDAFVNKLVAYCYCSHYDFVQGSYVPYFAFGIALLIAIGRAVALGVMILLLYGCL